MTWVIRIIYESDDMSKLRVGIEQALTDEVVERSVLDVRVETFKSMVSKLDKELKNENT